MAESVLSSEVAPTTVLPAASNLSATANNSNIDLSWSNNDDSPDGGIDVERSTDGFLTVTTVVSGLSTSTTSYTDSSVSQGETYAYRIERNTDHATATSGTVESTLFIRFLTGDGSGDAASSRSTTAARVQIAEGAGDATVERTAEADRGLTAEGDRGAASVLRTSSTARSLIGSGNGQATVSRTFTAVLTRSALGQGSGDAAVRRETTLTRILTAGGDRGAATVSRLTTSTRSLFAEGAGDAVVSWLAPDAWSLPETPVAGTYVLLTPTGIETDYESIALTATVSEAKRDLLAHYRRAGDVERQQTAFGAFRRIRRDGDDLLTVRPPASDSPPFAERRVAPVEMSAEQVAPRRHELSLTLGLDEPRAREPIAGDGEALTVDTETLELGAGATETITLSWTPDGSQLGDWTATVSSETDSDAQLVTVSNAPWTFAWPVATLSLTESRVGQIRRGSEAGVPSVTLPVRLDASQVATLLAVGSRIEAVELRQVPDAGNVAVDTLPGDELTCSLDPPADSNIEAGTYVLRDWSVAYARPAPPAYDAEITLVGTD
jgi:hypothetical protein